MERPAQATRRARSLRRAMTEAERWLWNKLRDRRLGGYKFVRQMPVGPFFADFACRESRLIVELDGSQHANARRDEQRDLFLLGQGFSVLRFWNHEVAAGIDNVCETILAAVQRRLDPFDRYRSATPPDPSSGPSGHLLPRGEKGTNCSERDSR